MTRDRHARRALDLVIHLRLHFQLMLGSIFLLGYVLAGGGLELRGALAFAVLHICLYGGATAMNSYYDRDEGPVGGLAVPPPARPELLPFALALQGLGLLCAMAIGTVFAALYAAMLLLGVGYSHPAIRWKARPWSSLLLVSIGQGLLGFGAGAAAARTDISWARDPDIWMGALTASLVTTALYPLTQIYQIEEDARRGDRTFAVAFGAGVCFRSSLIMLAAAAGPALWLLRRRIGLAAALAAGAVLAFVALRILQWGRRYTPADPARAMRRVMRLAYLTSGGFSLLLLGRLAGLY